MAGSGKTRGVHAREGGTRRRILERTAVHDAPRVHVVEGAAQLRKVAPVAGNGVTVSAAGAAGAVGGQGRELKRAKAYQMDASGIIRRSRLKCCGNMGIAARVRGGKRRVRGGKRRAGAGGRGSEAASSL